MRIGRGKKGVLFLLANVVMYAFLSTHIAYLVAGQSSHLYRIVGLGALASACMQYYSRTTKSPEAVVRFARQRWHELTQQYDQILPIHEGQRATIDSCFQREMLGELLRNKERLKELGDQIVDLYVLIVRTSEQSFISHSNRMTLRELSMRCDELWGAVHAVLKNTIEPLEQLTMLEMQACVVGEYVIVEPSAFIVDSYASGKSVSHRLALFEQCVQELLQAEILSQGGNAREYITSIIGKIYAIADGIDRLRKSNIIQKRLADEQDIIPKKEYIQVLQEEMAQLVEDNRSKKAEVDMLATERVELEDTAVSLRKQQDKIKKDMARFASVVLVICGGMVVFPLVFIAAMAPRY